MVTCISTEHENELSDFFEMRRPNKKTKQKIPIIKYNAFIKEVDRSNQMLSYYPCERKVLQEYKKVFVHVVQTILLNSHVLQNMYQEKMSLYEFRLEIIRALLPPPPAKIESLAQKKLRKSAHLPVKSTDNVTNNSLKHKKCQ